MDCRRLALVWLTFATFGCATVHQPPGLDAEKMESFQAPAHATADSAGTGFTFDISIGQATDVIVAACFELEIPLYHPMTSEDGQSAWLVSGPFIARCGRDCDCGGGGAGAIGYGSDLASGTISIRIANSSVADEPGVRIEISSMFSRTQSTSGDYSGTENLYFRSVGRIENVILVKLNHAQGVTSLH